MNPQRYNRLLFRLIALPIVALGIVAVLLGFGLARLELDARRADHSDQILAQGNKLLGLIIDEETGLRGYLLVHDPTYLQPLRQADLGIDRGFDKLRGMVGNRPDQVARLTQVQQDYHDWRAITEQEILSPPDNAQMPVALRARKEAMDRVRAQMGDFLDREQRLRDERVAIVGANSQQSRFVLIFLAGLATLFLVWEILRGFNRLTSSHNRRIAEITLRSDEAFEREQWLRTTLESIGDAVIACDAEGRVSFMNTVSQQLTGWSQQDAEGVLLHKVFPIFNEETREPVENPVDKVRRLGTIVGLANHTFLLSRNGHEIAIDDSGAPIRDRSGKMAGVVLVFRDISDRRVSEVAMMRAEKLAAAGRLAATVAHEVNNPLEGLTNLVYIARHSDDISEIRFLLGQAETELSRIAHITRQSLGFYRETTALVRYKPLDVVHEVADFYTVRSNSLGVRFSATGTTDRAIEGSPGELRQILSNLIANALDACSRGDSVRMHITPSADPRNPSRQGVRVVVSDTGQGIPAANLSSIFEPFFTTKKETGTGLGLWVSRELVEKQGGTMRVRSSTVSPHRGTIFSIFLPVPQWTSRSEAESAHTTYPKSI